MKKVIIIKADDWQVCYVNGKSISQSHQLGEGYGFLHFIKEAAKKYNFTLDDVIEFNIDEADEYVLDMGCFPNEFKELKGNYLE